VVKVVKGVVTSKQVEDEFTRIFLSGWRWTARKVADNTFTVRFPNRQLIGEWSCFNPISMRSVKAKLHIAAWNGSMGAKGELQMGWFRVRGVPYDKRSKATMSYVASLVGATVEVDKSTLGRTDYVRVKIAFRDISKVAERAEGVIIPFLYDFLYEREVEIGNIVDGGKVAVRGRLGVMCSRLLKNQDKMHYRKTMYLPQFYYIPRYRNRGRYPESTNVDTIYLSVNRRIYVTVHLSISVPR
jgi:hypothetical protein